ncbi:MAG: exodeoxyribonuclease VII large subunit [Candidatus Saccharimonadales bacterium]
MLDKYNSNLEFTVSDFVAVLNQTLEFAYPSVTIIGELSNLRVSKNKWVYFDLKDAQASVKFFGTIYQLPGPLEDGMMLKVRGYPRLHQLYGFSVTVQFIQPVGEGSIKKASDLLKIKLLAEGIFDENRKRSLPYPPRKIGLITSKESAAYVDFIKILSERWNDIEVYLFNVQVQGEPARDQIVQAVEYFNAHIADIEVIVITRGGGSADDLAVFNTEQVTRAIASSRTPTLVAIGHEVDISLAELAADKRGSTPTNAAQISAPNKKDKMKEHAFIANKLFLYFQTIHNKQLNELSSSHNQIIDLLDRMMINNQQKLSTYSQILKAYNPHNILKRGYAIIRQKEKIITSGYQLDNHVPMLVQLQDAEVESEIIRINNSST